MIVVFATPPITIPADKFPFLLEVFKEADLDGVAPLFRETVAGPRLLEVPVVMHNGPCWLRITWADGEIEDSRCPDGQQ